VEVHVNMGRWKRDYHYTLTFEVMNPRMTYTFGDSLYLGKEKEKKEGQPYLHLELETKNDTTGIPKFSPGEIIQGRLIIENGSLRRIKKARYNRNNKDMDMIAFGIQIPKKAKRSYSAKHSNTTGSLRFTLIYLIAPISMLKE
jgi:hypothetical protein